MALSDDQVTPRMREFRDKLDALMREYATDIGPEFGGIDEESNPMQQPMPVAWLLVAEWEDIANNDDLTNSSVVLVGSPRVRLTVKIGLLRMGLLMVEDE